MSETREATYSYDEVPYPSVAFPQSHPDRLAAIARLFGLDPAPVRSARILEIGCASGGNLIPLAEQLPRSRCLGIDLSARQVAAGRRLIEQAGLTNVELRELSVLDVDERLGQFDYVICHGVYSWVPPAVQEKILEVCSRNLAPNGVAYVSYNTFPGWHMRGMIREMMCYHTSRFPDPRTRIRQARALLDFLARNASEHDAFGKMLRAEVQVLRNHSDSYLYHEHLEDNNHPVYFFQFAHRAAAHGLQYLGEAELASMWSGHLAPDVAATVERVAADLVQMEQYTDFVRNRMFRQTLLCRQGLTIDRELKPAALAAFHVASPLVPVGPPAPAKFQHPGTKATLTTGHPLMKAAALALAEAWPGSVPYPRLFARASAALGPGGALTADEARARNDELGKWLFECYLSGLVELHTEPPCFTTEVPERPTASRVARAMVAAGSSHVTNLRHESGPLNEVTRQVLSHLDGRHDRAALVRLVQGMLEAKTLVMPGPPGGPVGAGQRVEAVVDQALMYLACNALLLAPGKDG